jgi:hypothetical protein
MCIKGFLNAFHAYAVWIMYLGVCTAISNDSEFFEEGRKMEESQVFRNLRNDIPHRKILKKQGINIGGKNDERSEQK